MITRFAPSPTGFLHLGHVLAAKMAFGAAEQRGGTCLLRIEDIDHTRCKPAYIQAIYDDLHWLGFDWPEPVRVQSQHREDYDNVIETLREQGLVYRCFKTRKELPPNFFRGAPPSEDETQFRLRRGDPFAWRLNMSRCEDSLSQELIYEETETLPGIIPVDMKTLGDEVVARKDIGTSYHIACCHDDALQGVTHVVRGIDIAPLTPFHRILQTLMGWPVPIYRHHGLLKNPDGQKLSKRSQDTSMASLREQGFTAAQVLDMASL